MSLNNDRINHLQQPLFNYDDTHHVPASPMFLASYIHSSILGLVEHDDDVAIINTPNNNNTTWLNQQRRRRVYPYVPNHHAAYESSSEVNNIVFNTSSVHAVLEESFILHALETEGAMRRQTDSMSGAGGSGLTRERISKLLRVCMAECKGEEEDNCCICLGEYGEKDKLGVLDCGHKYHVVCIEQWLLSKNSCPMCRSTALTADRV